MEVSDRAFNNIGTWTHVRYQNLFELDHLYSKKGWSIQEIKMRFYIHISNSWETRTIFQMNDALSIPGEAVPRPLSQDFLVIFQFWKQRVPSLVAVSKSVMLWLWNSSFVLLRAFWNLTPASWKGCEDHDMISYCCNKIYELENCYCIHCLY